MIQKLFQTLKAKNLPIYYWLSIACWLLSLCLPAYRGAGLDNIIWGYKLFCDGILGSVMPIYYFIAPLHVLSAATNYVYFKGLYKLFKKNFFTYKVFYMIIPYNIGFLLLSSAGNNPTLNDILKFPAVYFWLASFILLFIAFLKKENK
jgi:hypothetical protein